MMLVLLIQKLNLIRYKKMNSIQKRASEHLKKQKELLNTYTKEEDKKLIEIAINKYKKLMEVNYGHRTNKSEV